MADIDPESPPPVPLIPKAPKVPVIREPMTRTQLVSAISAVVFTAAVGVAAAFNFDLCAAFATVGMHVDACQAPAP